MITAVIKEPLAAVTLRVNPLELHIVVDPLYTIAAMIEHIGRWDPVDLYTKTGLESPRPRFLDCPLASLGEDPIKRLLWQVSHALPAPFSVDQCAERGYAGRVLALTHDSDPDLHEFSRALDRMHEILIGDETFQAILHHTEVSKNDLLTEWRCNSAASSDFVANLTRTPQNSRPFQVYLLPAALPAGMYLGNNNIQWSHQSERNTEKFANYSTVYLWHEKLHADLGVGEAELVNVGHALIQIIADNELRTFLNGGSYGSGPYDYEGHPEIFPLMHLIKNHYWNSYLQNPGETITEFEARLKHEPAIQDALARSVGQ